MNHRLLSAAAAVAFAAALSSCGGEPADTLPHLDVPAGCQPLVTGMDCLVPYPSDFFRVADEAMPSGFRVEVTGAAKPVTKSGANADVNALMKVDGFSRLPYIMAAFPNDVSPDGFVKLFDDPAQSAKPASNTLLIEADTGRLVEHFVDLDPRATDPKRRAIILHPFTLLKEKTRYVVALHDVKQTDGALVPVPEGFRRLRDGVGKSDPALQPLRDAYDQRILPAIEKAGVARADLQLAWEFTTGSDEQVTRDMLRVRELTMKWLETHTPEVVITKVTENSDPDVWRNIQGTITTPLFVENVDPGALLHRDANGQVAQNGTATFTFVAQVTNAVRDQFAPGRALSYGHGFFGGLAEPQGGSARHIANRMGAVMFAIEWWGMATPDVGKVGEALTSKPYRTFEAFDRVHQAMANWIVLGDAIGRVFPTLPDFKRPTTPGVPGVVDDGMGNTNAGQPVYAGGADAYVGISQGHILGGTMVALNPYIKRPILQMGGVGFTHMMFRARPFNGFLSLLDLSMPDPFEQQKLVATMQRQFDRFDPLTYARWVVTDKLPGNPDRRALLQYGLGDTAVPNFATHLDARMLGISQLDDGGPAIWGVPKAQAPVEGSAIATYDFGYDPSVVNAQAVPPDPDNEVHESVRKLESALSQMRLFLDEGRIQSFCDGSCNPE